MPKQSAGILLYRFRDDELEVLLVHPGGPFWAKKDKAAWSIPKGEFNEDEDPFEAAKREFTEETGVVLEGTFIELGQMKQSSYKIVHVWAQEGDFDALKIVSNTFEMEWPPKSGKYQEFPEIDRASWFSTTIAKEKLHKGQVPIIDRLWKKLGISKTESKSSPENKKKHFQPGLFE